MAITCIHFVMESVFFQARVIAGASHVNFRRLGAGAGPAACFAVSFNLSSLFKDDAFTGLRLEILHQCARARSRSLHTPHVPPSFAQCLQYLQFLHAWHGSLPVQVANDASVMSPSARGRERTASQSCLRIRGPPGELLKVYSSHTCHCGRTRRS